MIEREYIVTLKNYTDLDDFYNDMESPGGNLYIPNRAIDCVLRKPLSRNTRYLLTSEEASLVSQDPRVEAVELSPEESGLQITRLLDITESDWSKSATLAQSNRNWGILRCVEGKQRTNWGSNGTTSQSGTASVYGSGRNVDIVIVDGHFDPAHPEFAKNSDGSGGTRVIQYNWFANNPAVYGTSAGTYTYTPYDTTDPNLQADNNHGCHVAGTAAGNTQGWARSANLYNISPYSTNLNGSGYAYCFDHIRYWHLNKPINPETGRPNPTIMNNSWGFIYYGAISEITSVRYRGNLFSGPFNSTQLNNYGIPTSGNVYYSLIRSISTEADIRDCIDAGIISVGAAGNFHCKIDNFSSIQTNDYNNYFVTPDRTVYYMRGTISALDGMVCVGAVSSLASESKRSTSATGPRVDVFAPGSLVMSSLNSTRGEASTVNDVRNASYPQTKYSGTSMASPQVTGSLACLLETQVRLPSRQAALLVKNYAKLNQITATNGGYLDGYDILGGTNRYLYHPNLRRRQGYVGSMELSGARPSSGQAFPRTKIFRYGR